jgi:crossover junction endodeoxyribonuclease RusA
MLLEFPWPDPVLFPNNKSHYQVKAKSRAKQRQDAFYVSLAAGWPKFESESIPLTVVFCPPDKRRRDLDGLLSACKGLLDGVCDHWKVDDSRFRPITIDFGAVKKHGCVVLRVDANK